jgi:hypothetical protein
MQPVQPQAHLWVLTLSFAFTLRNEVGSLGQPRPCQVIPAQPIQMLMEKYAAQPASG